MRPPAYWHLKPGERRNRAREAHHRYFDALNKFRGRVKSWGMSIDVDVDVTADGQIVLSRGDVRIELPRDYGKAFVRAALNCLYRPNLNAGVRGDKTHGTSEKQIGPPHSDH